MVDGRWEWYKISYGLNLGSSYTYNRFWRIGAVRVYSSDRSGGFQDTPPSQFILMADSTTTNDPNYIGDESPHITPSNASWNLGRICLYHNGTANVLFGDGHIKNCTRTRLYELGWTAGIVEP